MSKTPVAIIGMAGIFPQAKNLREYWSNIINEVDCITEVPASRWKIEDYYDSNPNIPDKTYCKRGGFIPDIDFNPMEFGLPPNILEVTDVAQLLSLVVAKEALADAGYRDAEESIRQRTGVVLGIGGGQKLITPLTSRLQYPVWEKVLRSSGLSPDDTEKIIEKIKLAYIPWTENSFPGMLGNVISGRVANRLDLGGMNCVVDAACASSLSALRMALSELTEHRSDMMITGGVDTDNTIFMYMSFSKTPAFSPQGQIRSFDADADGMLIGEALGMMVLKRLSDAERDGDRIYAVIKGMGTSSDGKYKSIYAPRSSGQALALRRAYRDAGFAPETVGLIEAHGTGTVAGDPAEFAGLKQVFGENNPKKSYIALGSIKSQIGHTKSAAGAVSLIKVALGLHHKVLPPTINVTRPNPKLEIEDSPFYLNTKTRPWLTTNQSIPRRTGVSSFGFGGTNFHVVLEEYQRASNYSLLPTTDPILLKAIAPDKLLTRCQTIVEQLESDDGEKIHRKLINDSQNLDIPLTSARVGFITQSLQESLDKFKIIIDCLSKDIERESWNHPQGIYYRQTGINPQDKVVALFPGQGSQYLEMGRELAIQYPEMLQAYQQMDDVLIRDKLKPISEIVFPQPVFSQAAKDTQVSTLNKTENAQPAIGAFSMGLHKILRKIGFKPDIVAGHSFGELTALWAAKVLSDRDYCFLVKSRGQAMATKPVANFDAGKMLAVRGDSNKIKAIVDRLNNITIANWNSREQVVLAGKSSDILAVKSRLEKLGFTSILLPVSAAFHTPLVSHARQPFTEALDRVDFKFPQIPVYSNTTANIYPQNPESIKQILTEHLLNPVRFKAEIENIYQSGGRIFVEFGSKNILTRLVDNILGDRPHIAVCLHEERKDDFSTNKFKGDRQLQEAIIHLKVVGLSLSNIVSDEKQPAEKSNKPGLTIKLNGANYVSESTQRAFLDRLRSNTNINTNIQENAQPKLNKRGKNLNKDSKINSIQQKPIKKIAKQNYRSNHREDKTTMTQSSPQPLNNNSSHGGLEPDLIDVLMRFQEHQTHVNQIHQQYLDNQAAYTQQFLQLLQQQTSINHRKISKTNSVHLPATENISNERLPKSNPNSGELIEIKEQRRLRENDSSSHHHSQLNEMNGIVDVESETEKLKDREISNQRAEETIATATENISSEELERLTESLLTVVSDKTGYPSQMLELEMDMEADLGIDSIKRVEIMGAMQELYPDLPPFNPEELAELRTLGQIINYMGKQSGSIEKKKLI